LSLSRRGKAKRKEVKRMPLITKAEREERELIIEQILELWQELKEYCLPHIRNSLRYYFGISIPEDADDGELRGALLGISAPNGALRAYKNMLFEKRCLEQYRLRRLEEREAVRTEFVPSIPQPKQEIGWEL
jgi:hypothetical protein